MQLKEKETSSQLSAIAIAIAATFTAEPVGESLAFWMQELLAYLVQRPNR